MLNRMIQKKNLILIIYTAILLALWSLTLILGNAEDKLIVLISSLIVPVVVYMFVRLMYKIINVRATIKVMQFFYWFFLIGGLLCTVLLFSDFFARFPNGFSMTSGTGLALIMATLDSAKKSATAKDEN